MIPKDKLKAGCWYKGKGRNADVGLWTGAVFVTFGKKFDDWVPYSEGHWDEEGSFKPEIQIT